MPLCQIALSTLDLVRTAHWYRSTFDWKAAGEKRDREGETWARVPGLPEASFTVWWLVEKPRFFQFELFEFHKPRMRPRRADATAADLGYSSIGLQVPDLEAVLDRLVCTGGVLLTEPLGAPGERRVCLRDPEGVLLELMEGHPPIQRSSATEGPLATVNSIRLSVRDLDRAVRFWVDALGLEEERQRILHGPEHEQLWGLRGAKRITALLRSGDFLVELVEYDRAIQRPREAGFLLSDQGILNVALGTTDRAVFEAVYARAERAGYRPCCSPWTLPGVATVVYIQDGQGLTVELLCIDPDALERMGFADNAVVRQTAAGRAAATMESTPATLRSLLAEQLAGENGDLVELAVALM
jgi:catechol 2,3-dioxygenase-like lactoylglutathione lyase family enzyme